MVVVAARSVVQEEGMEALSRHSASQLTDGRNPCTRRFVRSRSSSVQTQSIQWAECCRPTFLQAGASALDDQTEVGGDHSDVSPSLEQCLQTS